MLACLSILMTLALVPQTPQTPPGGFVIPGSPPRDAATAAKGTAVIKGRVRSADGRALRRAAVSVRGAGLNTPRTASTGLEGEYEIRELPAGRYTIAVTRGGYLRTEYGQRHHGEPGTPIEIADGATLESIDIALDPAGVVSGRVVDDVGEPVANAQVWLQQMRFYQGRRQLVFIGSGRTDDTGLYRIASIVPGDYVVVAYFRETWASDDNKQTLGYAPSFFPGTAKPGDAQRIKVVAGQEATAIDITLVAGRAASISGTVTASDGVPIPGASVALAQELMGPNGGSMSMIGSTSAAGDGSFTVRNIPPGEYQLRAGGTPGGDRASETVTSTVVLSGRDITGLALGTNRGALITGRLVTDTGAPLPPGALRVITSSATFERSNPQPPPQEDGLAGADGQFKRRTPAGPVFIRPSGLRPGWALKQVIVGGRDYTELPIDMVGEQTLADVTVVVSNTLPAVSGRVTDARGAGGGPVVLVPADPTRWFEASGAMRSARPDPSGRFRFDNVRPGDYLAIAVERMEAWQVNDPEFLAPLREKATRVTVAQEPVTVDLRVIR